MFVMCIVTCVFTCVQNILGCGLFCSPKERAMVWMQGAGPLRAYYFKIYFIFNYLRMCLCGYVHVRAGACWGQRRTSDPLELQFQGVVSHLMWGGTRTLVRCESSQYFFTAKPSPLSPFSFFNQVTCFLVIDLLNSYLLWIFFPC